MPDETSQGDLYRDNIRRLSNTGLTYDLIFKGDKLANAVALVDAAPDVQFVLDHFGSPDLTRWQGPALVEPDLGTGQSGRTSSAKISGIIAYTDPEGWTVESLRPFFDRVIESFGWDRVVWGSDWPVCNLGGGLAAVGCGYACTAGWRVRHRALQASVGQCTADLEAALTSKGITVNRGQRPCLLTWRRHFGPSFRGRAAEPGIQSGSLQEGRDQLEKPTPWIPGSAARPRNDGSSMSSALSKGGMPGRE